MDEAHAPGLAAARQQALNGTPRKPRVTLQELLESLLHWTEQPQNGNVTAALYQHATAFFDVQNRITPAMISSWHNR